MRRSGITERVIVDFVAQEIGAPARCIHPQTTVNHELGLDGQDAAEFMEEFGERYSVDLGQFPFDRYFGPEAAGCLLVLLPLPPYGSRRATPTPLMVAQLLSAAQSGVWTE